MKHSILILMICIFSNAIYSQTEISDLDNDTKVMVDPDSADLDQVKFMIRGEEQFLFYGNRIEFLNSGSSVFIGKDAGRMDDQTSNFNVGIGNDVLEDNTTGDKNVAIGNTSMLQNISGVQNTAVGEASLRSNNVGERNVAIGQSCMRNNTDGSYNTAVGEDALYSNLNGNNNVAIGHDAGRTCRGSGNVFLGHEAGRNIGTQDNRLYIDNSNTSSPLIYGEFDNNAIVINGSFEISSDARLKYDFAALNQSLSKIRDLNGYSYKRKGIANNLKREVGLIAQDVRSVFPEMVRKSDSGYLSVNYTALIPVLIEAIKEQQEMIESLKAQVRKISN